MSWAFLAGLAAGESLQQIRQEMTNQMTGLREQAADGDEMPNGRLRVFRLTCANCQAAYSDQTPDHVTWSMDLSAAYPSREEMYAAAAAHGWDTWPTASRNYCPGCVSPVNPF